MIVYAVIPEEELNRLESIEKKYLELKIEFEKLQSEKQEKEETLQNQSDNLEGAGHDINIDGPPVVKPLSPKSPVLPANVISVETTNPISFEELKPFLPQKSHKRAQKLLEDLSKTSISVSKSGEVTIDSQPLANANGILLLKNTLKPLKKALHGKEEFERALNSQGLEKYFATRGPRPPKKRKVPEDWWFIGME